ncbi:MAG: hypothetical protein M0R50_10100 [Candidatus Cloacimonetes bacterium]|jgi:hypothetical protein|nr:hypothetical protein [Candidatus Cloacimonadota bacterium]
MPKSEEPLQEIDNELQSLLNDLEIDKAEDSAPQAANVIPEPITTITVPDPELSEPVVDVEQTGLPDLPLGTPTPSNITDLNNVAEKFDHDYNEVQLNLKRDRGRIDEVIDILLVRVRANADAETDTMSLVKALGVLADTNGHYVKLLDSRSKLLSATKSAVNAIQNNVTVTGNDAELQAILGQPSAGDE